MSLENYVENAWLRREPTSAQEIADQLGIVERSMRDAAVQESRTIFASTRPSTLCLHLPIQHCAQVATESPISRAIMLARLRHSSTPLVLRKLLAFSKKRNVASYDSAGSVSTQELEQILITATGLRDSVEAWLRKVHPEFLTK